MRSVIITGASAGIGRAVALAASRAGYASILVARRRELLQTLAHEIAAQGGVCETLALDICDARSAKLITTAALQRFGRIDIVVNNAGAAARGQLAQQEDGAVEQQFQTHVLAPLRLVREALPALRESRGQIIFFGSGVARVPVPGLGAYPAAKAAIRAIATQYRRELRGDNVAVTYVDPGVVDTDFMVNAGMKGPPRRLRASTERVARKIVRGFSSRPKRINAVLWQTAAIVAAEFMPGLTDLILAEVPSLAGTEPMELPAPTVALPQEGPVRETEPVGEPAAWIPSFEVALEPVRRRMERVKLTPEFIAGVLIPKSTLELGELAMRWAGMPNKNERAALREVLEVLATSGYLEQTGDDRWIVVREADIS
ncbi:MAG: SDR family NAD(P)-dependent oxidoreductase [Candidatus Eremiobacteraeota bacterium]|nr:SDR family NAD(P)-dependent oxidoreductase [Candidatus Eremiobacteraeota bacterium]